MSNGWLNSAFSPFTVTVAYKNLPIFAWLIITRYAYGFWTHGPSNLTKGIK